MRIYYDTEFVEDGRAIDLLSIGMIREDGECLYRVVHDNGAIMRALDNPWVRENVVANLPVCFDRRGSESKLGPWRWDWDTGHPDLKYVKPRAEVSYDVLQFVQHTPDPELWAWYGAYDHVALCQLFGRMVQLPDGFPMITCDVKQEAMRTCCTLDDTDGTVRHPGRAHNALHDAMWARDAHDWLIQRELDHLASSSMAMPHVWPRYDT